jgi:hypothetical protein
MVGNFVFIFTQLDALEKEKKDLENKELTLQENVQTLHMQLGE